MSLKSITAAVLAFVATTMPAWAEITIKDAYARANNTKAGAAFFIIENDGEADRLIDARADVAMKVELHTHKDMGDGIMKMMHVPDGFEIPAGGNHALMRGGDHVMFMGLKQAFENGMMIPVTLVFEKAGEVQIEVPVDLDRKPMHGGMKHGN